MTPILQTDSTVIGFLPDALSCEVTEERNGVYELTLTYPVSAPMFSSLAVDQFIKAKPNDTADNQLFRIYEITKPIDGIVTVNAEHISYALSHYPVKGVSGSYTATQAISALLTNANGNLPSQHGFSVSTTGMSTVKAFSCPVGTVRSALGGTEGSVLDIYGGEFEFDNKVIKLHAARGSDTGVIISYGKNLTDIKATTSMESSYTHLFPYTNKDGTVTTITNKTIAVTNTAGITMRVLSRDFTAEFDEGEEITPASLLTKANAWLNSNDINSPQINVTVSFIHLWQSPEYASVAALEKVSLCDTVTVRHTQLGVDIKTKVIKTVYDTISEKYVRIELGSSKANFADTLKETVNNATAGLEDAWKDDIESSSSAITQAYNAAIDAATKAITGYSGGYVVLNPSEHPQELLVMNSSDKNSATKLWRWNLGGLGYSNNGYNGPYTTAITMNGEIVADFITAGTLTANIIKAGILTDAYGRSSFNLETGLLTTSNINVTGGTIRIGSNLYYTEITNGNISQYGASDGSRVGGLTPLQSGNKFYEGLYYDDATALGVSIGYFAQDSLYYRIVEIKKNSAEIGGYLIVGSSAFSGILNKRDFMDGYGYKLNTRLGVGSVTGSATTLTFSSYSLYSSLNMPTSSYSKPSGVSNNTYYGRNTPSKTFYPLTSNIYRNGAKAVRVSCTMASYGWQQLSVRFYDGDGLEISTESIGSMCQTTVQTISNVSTQFPKESQRCVIGIIPDSGYTGYWGGWKNVTVDLMAEDGSASIELCDSSDNMIARLDVSEPKYSGGIARIRVQSSLGTSTWFELSDDSEIIGKNGNTIKFANDGLYYNGVKLAFA